MSPGEDRSRRLAPKLVDGDARILSGAQCGLALLDEGANQGSELVQRGPSALDVLLEGERKLGAFLELATEDDERSEDETSKERVEMRRAHGHVSGYAVAGTSPPSGSRDFDPEAVDATEVPFVLVARQNPEPRWSHRRTPTRSSARTIAGSATTSLPCSSNNRSQPARARSNEMTALVSTTGPKDPRAACLRD